MPTTAATPEDVTAAVDPLAAAISSILAGLPALATDQEVADAIAKIPVATFATKAYVDQAIKDAIAGLTPPTTPPVEPPPTPEVFEATDFKAGGSNGHNFPTQDIVGKGSAYTTYRVKPGTSTVANLALSQSTNPIRVVRAGGSSGALLKGKKYTGFTVEGYADHNQHGFTAGYVEGALLKDIVAVGIRGTGSSPPAETFSIEVWNTLAPTVQDCVIDGRNVAASLLGIMSTEGGVFERIKANNTTVGFGVAIWQSGNLIFRDIDTRSVRKAWNFEQCYGDILVERPDLRNRTSPRNTGPDIVVATAGYTPGRGPLAGVNQPSMKMKIVEPQWDKDKGPLIVGVPTIGASYAAAGGKPHSQRPEDVTVIIGGKTYVGPCNNSDVKIGNYWSG